MTTSKIGNFTFAKHVHHVLIANEFILLDEARDRYILVDESDSKQLLIGFAESKTTAAIMKYQSAGLIELSGEPERLNVFSGQRHGIGNHVWADVGSFRKTPYGSDTFFSALALVILMKLSILIIGFSYTLRLARRLKLKKPTSPKKNNHFIENSKIEEMAAAIYFAGLKLPFKIQCLESSLALFFYATVLNINSTLKIGVQRYDFLAHAWIEIEEKVIADDPELKTAMPVILIIEPRSNR